MDLVDRQLGGLPVLLPRDIELQCGSNGARCTQPSNGFSRFLLVLNPYDYVGTERR
jgi:hypothetical protein